MAPLVGGTRALQLITVKENKTKVGQKIIPER